MFMLFFDIVIFLLFLFVTFLIYKTLKLKNYRSALKYIFLIPIIVITHYIPDIISNKDSPIEVSDYLIVGNEGAYYPWNSVSQSGVAQGFDIDLANELAKRLKKDAKIVILPWDSLIPNLLNSQIEVIISALSITTEREKNIAFSIPYATVKASFFTKKDNIPNIDNIQTEEDIKKVLKNTVIGVQKGTTPAYFAEKMLKGIAKIKYYDTQNQLVLDLNSGRIFAGFSEIIPIQESISNSKNLILFGKLFDNKDSDVFGKGIAIGINQENQELLNKINLALKSMIEDGFIKNLSIKYFKTDVSISINK